ncbi:unnamed protein product [Camellia sinensis]
MAKKSPLYAFSFLTMNEYAPCLVALLMIANLTITKVQDLNYLVFGVSKQIQVNGAAPIMVTDKVMMPMVMGLHMILHYMHMVHTLVTRSTLNRVLRNCNMSGETPKYIWKMMNLQML